MSGEEPKFEGILLIDKPSGMTSHDVVDRVRRKLRMRRVGHAGTLDPNATGLLIILVGKATKTSQYLMSLNKGYDGTIRLGVETDSHDVEGVVVAEHPAPELTREEVIEAMKEFVGDQYQTPPMYSAKKVGGQTLYKMARKGKTVEREPRFIRVSAFDLLIFESPDIEFSMQCSKGTYVRTIAHDLGQKLGCGAHLAELRRTQVEQFSIDDALPLEEFEELDTTDIQRALIPVYQAVPSNVW